MIEKFVYKAEEVQDSMKINLEYYQIEETLNECCLESIVYGVAVKMMQIYDNGYIVNTGKRIYSLFCSENSARVFIEMLVRNNVTPTTLQEIAEDYIISKFRTEDLI